MNEYRHLPTEDLQALYTTHMTTMSDAIRGGYSGRAENNRKAAKKIAAELDKRKRAQVALERKQDTKTKTN